MTIKNGRQVTALQNPVTEHLGGFTCWLRKQRCNESTAKKHVGVCRKFGRYLQDRGLTVAEVHQGHLDEFLGHVQPMFGSQENSGRHHQQSVRRFVNYLQASGVCPTPIDSHLDGYSRWLRERGYSVKSTSQYLGTCRRFGRHLRRNAIALGTLDEDHVEQFVRSAPRAPAARRCP